MAPTSAPDLAGFGFHSLQRRLKRQKPEYSSATDFHFFARKHYETVRLRPKSPDASEGFKWTSSHADTAIVLQGPLERRDNFTLSTIRLYKCLWPEAQVILSTWEGTPTRDLSAAESLGAQIVLSSDPANPGPFNTNRQIVTSNNGLRRARDQGATWALKTRTDQRVHHGAAIDFMKSLARLPSKRLPPSASARVVVPSLNTFKFRLYGITDQLQFGLISDLLNFWPADLDERPPDFSHRAPETPREYAALRICEVLFTSKYLERTGWELNWTLLDSWESYASAFAIVDSSALDLLWPKYSTLEERWRRYTGISPLEEVSFAEWWLLANGDITAMAARYDHLLDRSDWYVPSI